MTKILYIVSALMMLVSALFIYQNRASFVKIREDRKQADIKTKTEFGKLEKLGEEISAVNDKLNGPSDAKTEAQVADAKKKLKDTQVSVESTTRELEEVQAKISDYKAKLGDIPDGVSIDTLTEDVNKIQTTIAENKAKAKELEGQFAIKDAEIKKAEEQLKVAQSKVQERRKLFSINSFSSRVVDVNNDWGFVVIQGGRDRGVTPQTKLIVTRGNQTIGKVNIISVEGTRTIANIIPNSVHNAQPVSRGDRVVLETLYQ